MKQKFRNDSGGQIDRSVTLNFTFDGKKYQGCEGDTLASALLANGVRLLGRSFKYHRPRGLLTAGSDEPNALIELRGGARKEPNTRATTIELFDGDCLFSGRCLRANYKHPDAHRELLSKVGDGDFRRRVRLSSLRP